MLRNSLVVGLAVLLALNPSLYAGAVVWNGSDTTNPNSWADGSNWNGGTAPTSFGSPGALTLAKVGVAGAAVNIDTPVSIDGLIISNSTASVSTTSGNSVTIGSTNSTLALSNRGTINVNPGGGLTLDLSAGFAINHGSGIINVNDGGALTLTSSMSTSPTLTNNGNINLNASSTGATLFLTGTGATFTLSGNGSLNLTDNATNQIEGFDGTQSLVNGANHTIQGSGLIDGAELNSFTNNGTINANSVINGLIVSAPLTNWSSITSSNTLTGGTYIASNNLQLNSFDGSTGINTLSGATVSVIGSGLITDLTGTNNLVTGIGSLTNGSSLALNNNTQDLSGGLTLDSSSNLQVLNGSTLFASGLTNNGTITVDSASTADFRTAAGADTFGSLDASGNLTGHYVIGGNFYFDTGTANGGNIQGINSGASLELDGTTYNIGQRGAGGAAVSSLSVNNGNFTLAQGAQFALAPQLSTFTFTNNGTLTIDPTSTGDFRTGTPGSFASVAGATGGTLTNGSYVIGGSLLIDPTTDPSSGITAIGGNASLQLDGGGKILYGPGSGTDALSSTLASNAGTFTLSGGAQFVSTVGIFDNTGTVNVNGATAFPCTGVCTAPPATSLIVSTFTNEGTLVVGDHSSNQAMFTSTNFSNIGGLVQVNWNGTANLGNLSNYTVGSNGGVLDGGPSMTFGAYAVAGTLEFSGGDINVIASNATVELHGANGVILEGDGLTNALGNLTEVAGSLQLSGGQSLTVTPLTPMGGGGNTLATDSSFNFKSTKTSFAPVGPTLSVDTDGEVLVGGNSEFFDSSHRQTPSLAVIGNMSNAGLVGVGTDGFRSRESGQSGALSVTGNFINTNTGELDLGERGDIKVRIGSGSAIATGSVTVDGSFYNQGGFGNVSSGDGSFNFKSSSTPVGSKILTASGGFVDVGQGSSLNIGVDLHNDGEIEVVGGTGSGGTKELPATTDFRGNSSAPAGSVSVLGNFINGGNGLLTLDSGFGGALGGQMTVDGNASNHGEVDVQGGATLTVLGNLTNHGFGEIGVDSGEGGGCCTVTVSTGTTTGSMAEATLNGTVNVGGNLTNWGEVNLNPAGDGVSAGGSMTVLGNVINHGPGSILVDVNASLTTGTDNTNWFSNHGSVTVNGGGTLTVNGDLTNHGSGDIEVFATPISSSVRTAVTTMFSNNGAVIVTGNASNWGLINLNQAGDGISAGGSMAVDGNFTNHSSGTVLVDVNSSLTTGNPMPAPMTPSNFFSNHGTVTVNGGGTLTVNGDLTNHGGGDIEVNANSGVMQQINTGGGIHTVQPTPNDGSVNVTGNLSNWGIINLNPNSPTDATAGGTMSVTGSATNHGPGTLTVGQNAEFSSAGFTNYGTLTVDSGGLANVVGGAFTNVSSLGLLSGGTYNIGGTFTYGSHDSLSPTISAIDTNTTVNLTAAGWVFQSFDGDSDFTPALAGLTTNSGNLGVTGGAALTVTPGNGVFMNSGSVTVGGATSDTSAFTVDGDYMQTDGTTTVNAGSTLTATNLDINGGVLSGFGTIDGNVTIQTGGADSPGDPGTQHVIGSYDLSAMGMLVLDFASTTNYDSIAAGSVPEADGTLDIDLTGYTPMVGDGPFTIITWTAGSAPTADFAAIDCMGCAALGVAFDEVINANNIQLDVVSATPEPSTFVLLLAAMLMGAGVSWQVRRRRA